MIWAFAPLAFLAGGLARRVAGGVLEDWFGWRAPGTPAKLLYAGTIGGLAVLGGAVWWLALLLAVNVFVGHVARGLWDAAGMGRLPPDNAVFSWRRFARDWFAMWCYGGGQVIIAAPVAVWLFASWWAPAALLFGGLGSSPAYALAWALWGRRWLPFWAGVSRNPLQLGEWLFGGCLAIGALLCVW